MPLAAGQTLAFYEILGPLGAGGMGEVWRARDTRLEREVAIKVLPDDLAGDEERLRRFEREAKTLASLNHPNVAGIHGVDHEEGTYFLALELVEGEDLAARLKRGRLPVDEAIDVCRQIAEGLEAAHEAGVVHRDLKPGNVRITPDGTAKLVDFGLAKPILPEATREGTTAAESDSFLVTEEGLVLGTPTYMSPEQARGRPVDRRADVWAFGCVLYECLTGKRAFAGGSLTDVLAAIVGEEPDWNALPPLPPRVRELLRRCLTKDPRARLRDVGEARVWLEHPGAAVAGDGGAARSRTPRRRAATLLGAAGLVVAAAWAGRLLGAPGAPPASPTRFRLDDRVADRGGWSGNLLAVSADARTVAYVGVPGDSRLHLRAMDAFEARAVPHTEGASAPFFAPDGATVAYWSEGRLMTVPVAGGTPSLLANTSRLTEACWGPGDRIAAVVLGRLVAIDARTGAAETLLQDTEYFADSPSVLPDGRTVLFDRGEELCALRADGTWRPLGQPGLNPKWSDTGHVVFQALDTTVWAVPFDPDALALEGPAVQLFDGPVLDVDVASDGTLVYVPGLGQEMELVWVDRAGEATPLGFESAHYLVPRLSPSEDRIAVSIQEGAGDQTDLWVLDPERGGRTRITNDGQWNVWAVWMHAGTRLAYMGDGYLWTRSADGTGEAQRLIAGDSRFDVPISWSEDEEALAYYAYDRAGDLRIWYADGGPADFLATPFDERSPHFSPDGRWIAYVSDQSGADEVYVRPHARGEAPDRRFAISTGGGGEPRWSRDGREIFYRRGTQMFAVSFEPGPTPAIGAPHLLFDRPYLTNPVGRANPNYDVAADGRFLMIRVSAEAATRAPAVHVVRGLPGLAPR